MFDLKRANAMIAALNTAFAEIGNVGATVMPKARKNLEPIAWELYVATHLLRIAEARKKKAAERAIRAGVIFDHEKEPLEEGTNSLIYAGELVEIAVQVGTPQTRVDPVGLGAAMEKSGISAKVVARLVAANTVATRAPHKFQATLITKR